MQKAYSFSFDLYTAITFLMDNQQSGWFHVSGLHRNSILDFYMMYDHFYQSSG